MYLKSSYRLFVAGLWVALVSLVAVPSAQAKAIKEKTIEYKEGTTLLEGFLAEPANIKGKIPAIVVVHEWMGLGNNAKKRARMLAELGYVAFAADIYGKGVRPANTDEAGKLATQYKSDRKLLRARVRAAYDEVKKMNGVDGQKIGVMGYCFGGTTALELARSGADLAGTVSFHGGLNSPTPDDAKKIRGRVLVLHGGDDPYVSATEVAAFQDEMRKSKVDWEMVAYGGAVHSFTNDELPPKPENGAAYDAKADKRSWARMKAFWADVFGKAL